MTRLLAKVDLRVLIADHCGTFVGHDNRPSPWDWLLFYGIPALPMLAAAALDVRLTDMAIQGVVSALAILAGLLFNFLVLLNNQPSWPSADHPLPRTALRLARQVFANVSYAIFVALSTLLPVVAAANYDASSDGRLVLSLVAIYLLVHFGLTMAMILKRMHVMLDDQARDRTAR